MEKYLDSLILIVDDEYANIFFLKKVLTGEGYNVITASNGYEAMEILDEQEPDLILLDIMMPEITGIDVLKRIQENLYTKNIPVIMVSAKTDSTDIENALDLGAIEYIKKPVDEIELLARIRTSLRIKNYEQQLRDNIKAKEDFINIVAHDLRTPFSSVSGFARILKEDPVLNEIYTEEHREFLNFIVDSSAFIVEYFNKLLHWAQIGSQGLKIKKEKFNLKPLIDTTLLIFNKKLDTKNLTINVDIPDELEINADEVYFSQVINNILGNSIKFTPQGGQIDLYTSSTDDGKLCLSIKDTGVGISEEVIEKVLSNKPVKSTKGTNGEKGTGLGLKICNKIINSHDFRFEIKSVLQEGSTFNIIF